MNANELADEFEQYLKDIEDLPWGNHQILCDQAATMLRQQQAEIEAMRARFTSAFWHDTFVEVKKPNSDLIYRFKLDETNDS
jgi:hypothetical protein